MSDGKRNVLKIDDNTGIIEYNSGDIYIGELDNKCNKGFGLYIQYKKHSDGCVYGTDITYGYDNQCNKIKLEDFAGTVAMRKKLSIIHNNKGIGISNDIDFIEKTFKIDYDDIYNDNIKKFFNNTKRGTLKELNTMQPYNAQEIKPIKNLIEKYKQSYKQVVNHYKTKNLNSFFRRLVDFDKKNPQLTTDHIIKLMKIIAKFNTISRDRHNGKIISQKDYNFYTKYCNMLIPSSDELDGSDIYRYENHIGEGENKLTLSIRLKKCKNGAKRMSFFFGKLNEIEKNNRILRDMKGALVYNGDKIISGNITDWRRWKYNKTNTKEINNNNGKNTDMKNLENNLRTMVDIFNKNNNKLNGFCDCCEYNF